MCGGGASAAAGAMVVVTGTASDRRVVGVQGPDNLGLALSDNVFLYPHSVASIPSGVSDKDAVSTLIASLAGVHCVLPRVEKINGSQDDGAVGGKVSIDRNSTPACFLM